MRRILLLLLVTQLAFGVSLQFSPATRQSLSAPGDMFKVSVWVTDHRALGDIAGASLRLTFDPAIIQITDSSGNPLTMLTPHANFELPGGGSIQNIVDNQTGQVFYDSGTTEGKTAPVVFVEFYVKAISLGKTNLKFERADSSILIGFSTGVFQSVSPASAPSLEITVGDVTPPEILDLLASEVTNTTATITLTTDEAATALIEYGKTGESEFLFHTQEDGLSQKHTFTLTALTQETEYTFRAIAKDKTGNQATSLAARFTTTNIDTVPPELTHTPITKAVAGDSVAFIATAADNIAIQKVSLFTRTSGSSSFQEQQMTATGGQYQTKVIFPAGGMDYYIMALDTSNNRTSIPTAGATAPFMIAAVVETGTLQGTVTEKISGAPLNGVTLFVQETGKESTTDSQGAFSMTLPSGSYVGQWEKTGYVSQEKSFQVSTNQTTQLDLALEKAAILTGSVLRSTDGEAISQATITAGNSSTKSDSQGHFNLQELSPKTYQVEVKADAYTATTTSITLQAGETVTKSFLLVPLTAKRVVIFPSFKSLAGGEQTTFQGRAVMEDGSVLTGFPLFWKVSPAFLGTINNQGQFQASNVDSTGLVFATLEKGTLLPNGGTQPISLRASSQILIQREFFFVSISANQAPFSPKKGEFAKIHYKLSQEPEKVEVRVYSLHGRLLRKLEGQAASEGKVLWDGKDETGKIMENGVYGYRILSTKNGKTVRSDFHLVAIFQ